MGAAFIDKLDCLKDVCVHARPTYLLAQRHPAAQGAGQANDFGHKRLESQVLLQYHPPQDGLHLRDTRPCNPAGGSHR